MISMGAIEKTECDPNLCQGLILASSYFMTIKNGLAMLGVILLIQSVSGQEAWAMKKSTHTTQKKAVSKAKVQTGKSSRVKVAQFQSKKQRRLTDVLSSRSRPVQAVSSRRELANYGRSMSSIGGVQESHKAIEVRGQSRNLSMLLTLKSDKDKIKFVEVRRDFKNEINGTHF